jgi:hypothetical protein
MSPSKGTRRGKDVEGRRVRWMVRWMEEREAWRERTMAVQSPS